VVGGASYRTDYAEPLVRTPRSTSAAARNADAVTEARRRTENIRRAFADVIGLEQARARRRNSVQLDTERATPRRSRPRSSRCC
jgi:hypothetical protein